MNGPLRLDRSLIRVSGPEAMSFLDNLLTQDLERLAEAGVLYAALLSPQGKVLCDMLLWREGDGVVIETAPSRAPDLLRRLTMYKLRAQVAIEDVSAEFATFYAPAPFSEAAPDPRFPNGELGWRRLAPNDGNFPDGAAAYEARRFELGVPDLARDADSEEVFALEALLEELNGVDFSKGCFVGQENVSRMKRRATTRKKFCPLSFEGDPPAYGAPVTAGEIALGTVRTGTQGRALALLRLDRALEALDAGHDLTVEGRRVVLEPPSWLIMPARKGAAGEAD